MGRSKTYKSVGSLLRGMGLHATAKAAEQHIAEHSIAQKLTVCRAKAGLTRKELAQKMGVSERTVARIEAAPDGALRIKTIKAYAKALGFNCSLRLSLLPRRRS